MAYIVLSHWYPTKHKPLDFQWRLLILKKCVPMSTLQKHGYMNPLSPSWPQLLANKALNTSLFCQCWSVLVPFSGLRQARQTRIDQEYRHPGIYNFTFTTIRQTVRWHEGNLQENHGGLAGWTWNIWILTWREQLLPLFGPISFRRHQMVNLKFKKPAIHILSSGRFNRCLRSQRAALSKASSWLTKGSEHAWKAKGYRLSQPWKPNTKIHPK